MKALVVHVENKGALLSQPLHPNAEPHKSTDALGEISTFSPWQEPREMLGQRLQMRSEQVGDPHGHSAAVTVPPSSSLPTGDVPSAPGRMMGFVVS